MVRSPRKSTGRSIQKLSWEETAREMVRFGFILAILACGGDGSVRPDPDPVDPNSIESQITALFPAGPTLRDAAMTRIASVRQALAQSNSVTARSQALALVDLTLTSLGAGTLTGGKVASTRASASRLVDAVYQLVSLTAPAIPEGALTDDGAAKIVGPGGGTVATANGGAGVQFPTGTLPTEVLVTIVRIPSTTTPGTGPLPTTLKQYPPYYDFATTPVVVFSDSARVGICQATDPSNPFYPPEPHDRLRLAHTVGPAGQTTLEILNPVPVDDIIRCTSVAPNTPNFIRATDLFAAHGGLGGKTKSFSPFGAVDPLSGPVASVTLSPNPLPLVVGATGLLTATTRDASNNVVTGRLVTWSTSSNIFATVTQSGLVTAVTAGTATITALSEGKTATAIVRIDGALSGMWNGTYSWTCSGGGFTPISFMFNANSDPASYTVTAVYRGSPTTGVLNRYSSVVVGQSGSFTSGVPSGNGQFIQIGTNGGATMVNNVFSGSLSGTSTISGTTQNGESGVNGGCSANTGPAGTFTVSRQP